MTPRTSALAVGVLALVVLGGHLTLFPRVADLDAFYHIGHALAYAEGSLFDPSLPWATKSVIGDLGGDIWWGLHVLLVPFTVFGVQWGIRVAALLLTAGLAATVWWILSRHRVSGAAWWTALSLVVVPNVFFRHLMLRPHMISLAASLAILSLLVKGRARWVFLASALVTWVHLSLFWMPPCLAVAYLLVRWLEAVLGLEHGADSVPATRAVPAAFLGTVVGWVLRPEPVAAGALANVQIIRLFAQKALQEPLLFAAELAPISFTELALTSWFFLGMWGGALLLVGRSVLRDQMKDVPAAERTFVVTTLLVSVVFAGLALLSMRRAMVQWVAFGAVGTAVAASHLGWLRWNRPAVKGAALLLAASLVWGGWRHTINVERVAFEPDTLESAARFLDSVSEPGEVVFHPKFDNFGPLLAHNRRNLYIGGMDPIFQFVHEPRFYWEYFYISADVNVEWTCDAFPCSDGVATDTHDVLRDHFGARWVVVEPRRNPRFALYLLNDGRYRLAHESPRSAVFEVLGTPEPPPAMEDGR